jgi:hypothetical protein
VHENHSSGVTSPHYDAVSVSIVKVKEKVKRTNAENFRTRRGKKACCMGNGKEQSGNKRRRVRESGVPMQDALPEEWKGSASRTCCLRYGKAGVPQLRAMSTKERAGLGAMEGKQCPGATSGHQPPNGSILDRLSAEASGKSPRVTKTEERKG